MSLFDRYSQSYKYYILGGIQVPEIRCIDILYFVSSVTRAVIVGMRSFKYVNYIAGGHSNDAGRLTEILQS
jgi:hypothetical protein